MFLCVCMIIISLILVFYFKKKASINNSVAKRLEIKVKQRVKIYAPLLKI